MAHFSEEVFLHALCGRSEDVRRFSSLFKPEWLQTAMYRPLLQEIYSFTKKNGIPPNVKVLREIFKKRDEAQYNVRYSKALDKIEGIDPPPETPEIIYTLEQAKDVAVSWSFKELAESPAFTEMNDQFDGAGQIRAMENWIQQFLGQTEDIEVNLKEAVERLIEERGWMNRSIKIPCGIKVIDEFTNGGLRVPGLGIIMAPTGAGKSNCLIVIAQKIAAIEQKRVLFVTNELSTSQVTERFLSSLTGENLSEIIEDPVVGYKGLERHWVGGLDQRLRMVEVLREISTDDLESMVGRYINLYGWAPDVMVIDFMERMKPTVSGVKRDQSWNWFGAIAQELVRISKKNSWLIWTAGQTNRAGLSAKVQDLSHGQGSIKHFQEASAVIGMHQLEGVDTGDSNVKLLEFRTLKMRESAKPAESIIVEANFSKMEISDRRRKMQEFIDPDEEEDDVKTPRKNQVARQKR